MTNRGITVFFTAIALSAGLLFLIQPLIAKSLLPQFGGGANIWTVSLVFFQALLLAGYAYAHFIRRFSIRVQVAAHGLLLLAAITALPAWNDRLGVTFGTLPEVRLVAALFFSIGLPYFVLAANGPLLQAWLAGNRISFSIYKMYALSNAGSFIGLFAYPFLLEPFLGLQKQEWLWSLGFLTLAVLIGGAGLITLYRHRSLPSKRERDGAPRKGAVMLAWLLLSALTGWLLVSVTTAITQDIASFPLLWVLPLGIYLFTFILSFETDKLYDRTTFGTAFAASLPLFCLLLFGSSIIPHYGRVSGHLIVFFLAALVAHGELSKRKPEAGDLTFFYLTIAAGGVIGGSAAALGAPYLFSDYFELPVGMMFAVLIFGGLLISDPASPFYWKGAGRKRVDLLLWGSAVILLLSAYIARESLVPIAYDRNFYGVLRVKARGAGADLRYELVSGTTLHGAQYAAPERQEIITSYYTDASGIGIALRAHQNSLNTVRVGVVGLGAGTIAAYGRPGDQYVFYEINRLSVDFAKRFFTFLSKSRATIDIVEGDARLLLAKEDRIFDVLAVDAFTSDSIPTHLLTEEAFGIYLKRLAANGILGIHISNRHLDLEPVIKGAADAFGLSALVVNEKSSSWAMLARKEADFPKELRAKGAPLSEKPAVSWTDDFTTLIPILRVRAKIPF